MNFGDLLEELCKLFPDEGAEDEEDRPIQIAVVGKPNVGKSSLVNRILGEERVMVSDIAGTTRDAIDTRFTDGEESFVIIDTAGIRRNAPSSSSRSSVTAWCAPLPPSTAATWRSCSSTPHRASRAGYQDRRLHRRAGQGGAVVCVNKWDAVEKETGTMEKYVRDGARTAQIHAYAPVLFISARTGQRTQRVLDSVRSVYAEATRRVTTGVLNDVMAERAGGAAAPGHLGPPPQDSTTPRSRRAGRPRSCFLSTIWN